MVELSLRGRKIEGSPLAWNDTAVCLLGRDGWLWEFDPAEARDFRKTSNRFRSYLPSEFRAMLLRELGGDYEVSGTRHYLVAHPRGQRDRWAERFEQLYRSFVQYFSVRGFSPKPPPFPLVGIVCKDRKDFQRYTAAQGSPMPGGVLGFYDSESNRIVLYDAGGAADSSNWQSSAVVVIHEATHQTAFNTGVHSRWCLPPLWVAEGLATLFEAPGVYNARHYPQRADRINRMYLRDFQMTLEKNHRPELLQALVASDQLFRTSSTLAYAESWALTFFLVETEPRKYARYLSLTANRPPFSDYGPAERTADFTSVFGTNWPMLEARFLRFMAGVK